MSELDRYIEIASKLSFLSKEKRFIMEEMFDLTLDSSEIVKIGPFQEGHADYMQIVYWQEKPTDEFVVYMESENWESWGHMYSDDGNNFHIAKIAKYVPVFEPYWDAVIDAPKRFRW